MKRLISVHVLNPITHVWTIVCAYQRTDRPSYQILGPNLILDPAPNSAYQMQVVYDV
jgi:hypothetical protein